MTNQQAWNIRLAILATLITALVWMDLWAGSIHITTLPIAINSIISLIGAVLGVSAFTRGTEPPAK